MNNLSTASRRTHLHTTLGTVIYVDAASGQLRHGTIDERQVNVVLIAEQPTIPGPQTASLMYNAADIFEPIVISADRCCRSSSDPTMRGVSSLRVVRLDSDLVALQSGGLYLCAEADGRITLSRAKCSLWECFVTSRDWASIEAHPAQLGVGNTIDWPAIRSFKVSTKSTSGRQEAKEPDVSRDAKKGFAFRRVIVMRHRGNLANKMLQYMGALTLASRIKDCTIVNVSIPEWGIEIPDNTKDELFFENVDLWTWDPFRSHVEELCIMANRSKSIRIMLADHLLRMEFLMRPQFYERLFPRSPHLSDELNENDLLINIRTAEILDGIPHYPLLPISFYEDVVARTGLKPVFAGQLDESEYVRQLKLRFPEAKFIDTRGAIADFNLIRSAKNIVVAISTFSWLAAWLSDATTVFLPLSGFYNPTHHREVDLLPVDDIRYRYFLFPLNFGLSEKDALQYHERIKGCWNRFRETRSHC